MHFERGVQTLGAPARILSKGFRLWALRLAFRVRGSDFGRSGSYFEQGVQTLGAPARISSEGFRLWALRLESSLADIKPPQLILSLPDLIFGLAS